MADLTDPRLKTAIDYARSMVGETPSDQDLRDYLKGTLDPRKHDWCTAFLNATLKKAGIAGTPSMMANSFLTWGRHVDPKDVRAGDVIVTGEDDEGPHQGGLGHSAIVTGPIHKGTRPGQQDSDYAPTISGNWSHRVKEAEVLADPGTAEFRRALPSHRAQMNVLHRHLAIPPDVSPPSLLQPISSKPSAPPPMAGEDAGYPRQISRMALLRGTHLQPWVREELTGGSVKVLKEGQFVKPDATFGRPFFTDEAAGRKKIENDPAIEFTPAYPEPGKVIIPGSEGVIENNELHIHIHAHVI